MGVVCVGLRCGLWENERKQGISVLAGQPSLTVNILSVPLGNRRWMVVATQQCAGIIPKSRLACSMLKTVDLTLPQELQLGRITFSHLESVRPLCTNGFGTPLHSTLWISKLIRGWL
jgi:hypothetical protein